MLIAEDLLLLVLDDEKGTLASPWVRQALGGAILTELSMLGAVQVMPRAGLTPAKVIALPGERPDDRILAAAHDSLAAKPLTPKAAVNNLGKGLHEALAARLCDRGILKRRDDRILGLFPRVTWPTADATHENGVRSQLVAVLVQGASPDPRTGPLIALLHAIGMAHKVVDTSGVGTRAVKARAKQIAAGDWAAQGVKQAIDEITTVVAGSVAATSAANA